MKVIRLLLLLALVVSMVGCGKPVPPEKSTYVGEWQEKTMYLLITQDGSVKYKRLKGGVSTSVEGPAQGLQWKQLRGWNRADDYDFCRQQGALSRG